MATAKLDKAYSANASGSGQTYTFSVWVKRAILGAEHCIISADATSVVDGGQSGRDFLRFESSDELSFRVNGGTQGNLTTNRIFRDVNAWYHIVVQYSSTDGTSGDRIRMYINGTRETSFSTSTFPSQNYASEFPQNTTTTRVGGDVQGSGSRFDGCMADFYFCDGQALDQNSFGEFDSNGVWKPKINPSLTFGTNGFKLEFANDSNMGLDTSGSSNNFTTSGTIIQNKDTPTNNHPTINKLDRRTNDMTVTNAGNTGETNASVYTPGTMSLGADSGKWYWEIKVASKTGSSDWHMLGIMGQTRRESNVYLGQVVDQYGYYGLNGYSYTNNSGTSYGNSYGVGDIIGIAMDLDNNKLYFHKNGTYQNSGVPTSGSTGTGAISITAASATDDGFYRPAICYFDGSTKATYQCNFGNGYFGTTKITSAGSNGNGSLFEYDVPTGYYALNTKNLKDQS